MGCAAVVDPPPLNVEDAVGGRATDGSEDATASREGGAARLVVGAQVIPVGENCVGQADRRQAAMFPRNRSHEAHVTVGVNNRLRVRLVIEGVGEGEQYSS